MAIANNLEKEDTLVRRKKMWSDRRANFRLQYGIPFKISSEQTTEARQTKSLNAQLLDIGLGGLRFSSDEIFLGGTKVRVRLELERFGIIEDLSGSIVWQGANEKTQLSSEKSLHKKFDSEMHNSPEIMVRKYGISFDQTSLDKIHTLVKFLDSTVSSRHSRKILVNRRRFDFYLNWVAKLKEKNMFYEPRTPESAPAATITIGSREVIQLSSNNSLGFSTHPKVLNEARRYLDKYGTGCGGSRLISGNLIIHKMLEKKLANFMGFEDAIVYMTGYMGNLGAIEALTSIHQFGFGASRHEVVGVFCDHDNHKSIVQGCQIATQRNSAVIRTYDHLDMNQLEEQLKTTHTSRKLIITEGVFSMKGDIAPLTDLVSLAKKYKALLYLDDAHAIGHLGKTGRGTMEHWGVTDVDIVLGTFSKAFGAAGGFLTAREDLCEYLRLQSNTYIFSSALPPATVGGVSQAIDLVDAEPEHLQHFWENARYFRNQVNHFGFDTLGSQTHITPIFIGDEEKALRIAESLFEKDIFIPVVRWPAVDHGRAIFRCMVTSQHTKEQLDYVAIELAKLGRREGII